MGYPYWNRPWIFNLLLTYEGVEYVNLCKPIVRNIDSCTNLILYKHRSLVIIGLNFEDVAYFFVTIYKIIKISKHAHRSEFAWPKYDPISVLSRSDQVFLTFICDRLSNILDIWSVRVFLSHTMLILCYIFYSHPIIVQLVWWCINLMPCGTDTA